MGKLLERRLGDYYVARGRDTLLLAWFLGSPESSRRTSATGGIPGEWEGESPSESSSETGVQ